MLQCSGHWSARQVCSFIAHLTLSRRVIYILCFVLLHLSHEKCHIGDMLTHCVLFSRFQTLNTVYGSLLGYLQAIVGASGDFPSLLPVPASSLFGKVEYTAYVPGCPSFAFVSLLMETAIERPMWLGGMAITCYYCGRAIKLSYYVGAMFAMCCILVH